MKLTDLCKDLNVRIDPATAGATDIAGLAVSSQKTGRNFLFAALPGNKAHGIQYLDQAIAAGATAVLTDAEGAAQASGKIPAIIHSQNVRHDIAIMASRFYPRHPKTIAAITGTNGKTSGTVFARQIWQMLGHRSASLGTIGLVTPDRTEDSSLTTPDSISFHQIMQQLADEKITHLAFEAGSHGLHQNRIAGVCADIGAFTNLTRDHLDYHKDMEDYFQAKLILFTDIVKSGGAAAINRDIAEFQRIKDVCDRRQIRVISFGKTNSDIQIINLEPQHDHQIVTLGLFGKQHKLRLPLIGAFQAFNAACALGMAIGSGEDPDKALNTLTKLEGVPGRMQLVAKAPSGAPVFVDYAHTPDAIDNVLRSLRPHTKGKLAIIFGCGGDRDPGKRPLMGKIAADLADRVVVSDDNPRTEDAAKIRAQILTACPGATEIGDRAQAIAETMRQLGADDILVIAGKGHEQGQIVGKVTLPFDDADVARKAERTLKGAAA